jgi:negative regulator of flagellin synthesis FlgM
MSIDRISRQQYINAYSSNKSKSVDRISKSKDVDRIEISEAGKSLKNYSSANIVGNTQKVADIKNKIDSGTYNVDARLTAQSLLNAIKESNA